MVKFTVFLIALLVRTGTTHSFSPQLITKATTFTSSQPALAKLSKQTSLVSSSSPALTTVQGGAATSSATTTSDDGDGTATIPSHVFNLVKGIVGAGVLALPSGIATFGNAPSAVIPAILLICIIGALSGYGFALIGRVCYLTGGSTSYREAWKKSISDETSWIPAVSVTFKTICAVLAYSMILSDTFYSLFVSAGITNTLVTKHTILIGLTGCVLLPLCLLKNLSSLAPFSLLGTLGMIYTAVAMFIRYSTKAYVQPNGIFANDLPKYLQPSFGTKGALAAINPTTSILLGMLSTAYMAHFNAPKFYKELSRNTIPRYLRVVTISFAISIVLFAIITCIGFLTFGGNCSGLILNNYSTRDQLMGLSRIAVAISLVFSYPLAFTGARDGIMDLFRVSKTKQMDTNFVNTITVGILSVITIMAMIIPDVSFVLAFAGYVYLFAFTMLIFVDK